MNFWRFVYLVIFSLLGQNLLFAQAFYPAASARAQAMGGATTLLNDHWSALHNPAGLSSVKAFSIGASASRPYNLRLLNISNVSAALPIKNVGTIAIGGQMLSLQDAYRQYRLHAAVSRKFGPKVSVGMAMGLQGMDYFQYGSAQFFTMSVGFVFEPVDRVRIGAHIHNPISPQVAAFEDERLPGQFHAGAAYYFHDSLWITSSIQMSLYGQYRWRTGIEYVLSKRFVLRAGFATQPLETAFGIAFRFKHFRLQIAAGYHSYLGTTPHLSFDYAPGR